MKKTWKENQRTEQVQLASWSDDATKQRAAKDEATQILEVEYCIIL